MSICARLTAILALLALVSAEPAHGEGWHSAQPPPPAPPEGESSVGVPVALGHVGDIEFWAPNRGLLITAGTQAVHAGLYYYDGVSWHELSTVCGGKDGRIAWAGPDDFWTISDQQPGQQLEEGVNAELEGEDRSLCHFVDGQVVASYAEPIGVPGSYRQMDAAACSGPNDCWFAGEILPPGGADSGAFHLHWNGHTMSAVPSLEVPEPQLEDPARKVADTVSYKGRFYESVQVQQSDQVPGESPTQPYLLHRIAEGSNKPFVPLIPEGTLTYGEGVKPWELSAFHLSGDESALWAFAGPVGASSAAQPTAVQLGTNGFHQIKLSDPTGALGAGDEIAGAAAEPGGGNAWVSIDPTSGQEAQRNASAHLARIEATGTVEAQVQLPETGEALGHKGPAGVIACPAANDCWVATAQGWLFHRGGTHPRDEDPYFQALVTSRPPDASIPFVPSDEAPPDTSGANVAPVLPRANEALGSERAVPRAHEALFSKVHSRLVHGTTLALTFTLATKSHVRLLALRHRRTVAATRPVVLGGGRHTLSLHLDRRAWPTKLDLRVKAIGAVPFASEGGGAATGGPAVVTTSLRDPATVRRTGPFAPELFASPLS